ncbi:MAG: hypothetical protein ACREPQ_01020 [Rhodanobacter sp.]
MLTKDDMLDDSVEDVAEARLDHVAEQVAIRIIVNGTSEDVAVSKALAVQNLQDHATIDQIQFDENEQPIGYFDSAMQDLPMPTDERVKRQVMAVVPRIREKLDRL